LEEFNREMRWLHNRSLHQPGVGNGFAVYGKRGDRQVLIGPGYATDSLGREITLTEQFVDPIPPVAGNQGKSIFFDLTVSYPDDSTLEEAERREGICVDRGVVRLREEPVFCWVELAGEQLAPKKQKLKAELEAGLKIRLARIEVLNCELYSDVSIDQRQNARPPLTPYIFSNTESLDPASVFAGPLTLQNLPESVLPLLILGNIDTSAAEFLTTPEYRAHFVGGRRIFLNTTSPNLIQVATFDQFQINVQRRASFDFADLVLVIGIGQNPVDLNIKDVLDDAGHVKPNVRRIDEVVRLMLASWQVVWMGIEG
jgi:hypothetical protein